MFGDGGLSLGVIYMSTIIAEKTDLLKSFWLYFHIVGIGDEWIEYNLPIPTLLKHINRGYYVAWAIDGYFGTKKSQEFLNDIIARFLISFKEQEIKRLAFKPTEKDLNNKTAHILLKAYKLKEFSKQLKSLPVKKQYAPARADMFEDHTFWAIKLYSEDMIRATGFIVYESLENWALSQFEHKERSTIRAKCRSVYNWYEARDWKLPERNNRRLKDYLEETMASRTENMKKISAEKAERNRKLVINLITGMFADDYKKKSSGAWHYSKIAKDTNLSRYTVAKIIKNLDLKNIV